MSDAPQNQDKFVVRLPDGMREQVKTSAERNNRSMNAEIIVALNMYLGITDGQETDFSDPKNFNLVGLPKEEQLRRIVEGSAKTMYQQLKEALDRPAADISNPPDLPPLRDDP